MPSFSFYKILYVLMTAFLPFAGQLITRAIYLGYSVDKLYLLSFFIPPLSFYPASQVLFDNIKPGSGINPVDMISFIAFGMIAFGGWGVEFLTEKIMGVEKEHNYFRQPDFNQFYQQPYQQQYSQQNYQQPYYQENYQQPYYQGGGFKKALLGAVGAVADADINVPYEIIFFLFIFVIGFGIYYLRDIKKCNDICKDKEDKCKQRFKDAAYLSAMASLLTYFIYLLIIASQFIPIIGKAIGIALAIIPDSFVIGASFFLADIIINLFKNMDINKACEGDLHNTFVLKIFPEFININNHIPWWGVLIGIIITKTLSVIFG